ncbi:hypothetical protein [Acetobacter sicerae]|uniref:hypothetical protein n=1 Tax=Acetobacter sicerae TaxID=85325 RepID=UPI00156BD838|nr:hypothetical protein [Acetobacter sicerae]NHN93530.1 hypothetical protein [Acetobacter sicerae]
MSASLTREPPVLSWGSEHTPFQRDGRVAITEMSACSTTAEYAAGHLGFYGYLRVANRICIRAACVGIFDLPDRCWRESYEAQEPPEDVVREALEEEGFTDF